MAHKFCYICWQFHYRLVFVVEIINNLSWIKYLLNWFSTWCETRVVFLPLWFFSIHVDNVKFANLFTILYNCAVSFSFQVSCLTIFQCWRLCEQCKEGSCSSSYSCGQNDLVKWRYKPYSLKRLQTFYYISRGTS